MKQYHNYIFDLYGTLIDIETDENRLLFWKKLAERFQLGDNYSALRKQYLSLCEKAQKKNPLVHAEIDLAPIFRELFQTHDDQKIAYMAYEFRKMSRKKFRLFPGVTETLETIRKRGGHCYLLSNAQALFTRPELEESGLDQYLDGICISSEFGLKKPDILFMEHLLSKYQLDRSESIMIGNDFTGDMECAQRCQMDSLFINSGGCPEDTLMKMKKIYDITAVADSVYEGLKDD